MLRFPSKPTPAAEHFTAAALEYGIYWTKLCDDSDWSAQGTRVARCFSRQLAAATMATMLEHLRLEPVFQLNDYHWLLLHDAVESIAAISEDEAESELLLGLGRLMTEEDSWAVAQPGGHIHIDVGSFEDAYFWDADFELSAELLDWVHPDSKPPLRVADETWGVAHGLAPHPSELGLVEEQAPWS